MEAIISRKHNRAIQKGSDGVVRTYEVGRSFKRKREANLTILNAGTENQPLEEMTWHGDNAEIQDWERVYFTEYGQIFDL